MKNRYGLLLLLGIMMGGLLPICSYVVNQSMRGETFLILAIGCAALVTLGTRGLFQAFLIYFVEVATAIFLGEVYAAMRGDVHDVYSIGFGAGIGCVLAITAIALDRLLITNPPPATSE